MMRRIRAFATRNSEPIWIALLAIAALLCGPVVVRDPLVQGQDTAVRFEALDLYVDSGATALAAFQIELRDPSGRAQVVGIEGGEHAAFHEPPYYDPRALRQNRVILAAFSTASELPSSRTRVARVMMQVTGEGRPDYELKLVAAATADGQKIEATIESAEGSER